MNEANPYNHYESVYWVFTQLCNDKCDHCYNSSGPGGERISQEDCMAIIENLPDTIDRLILSGGEPLADKKLLYAILDKLMQRYEGRTQIMLQTNGDLLNGEYWTHWWPKGLPGSTWPASTAIISSPVPGWKY